MIVRGRRITLSQPTVPQGIITMEVTYSAPPTSPTVSFAAAKYNKPYVFNFEQDDSPDAFYSVVFKYLFGGIGFGSVSSPGVFSDDGCGNPVNWRAAIACFCVNSLGVDLMSGVPGYITYDHMFECLQGKFSVMNHQFGGIAADIKGDSDRFQQIRDLSQRVWEQMLSRGMQYRIRGMVNPAADPGYTWSGFNTSIKVFSSSAGVDSLKDGYEYYGDNLFNSLPLEDMAIVREYMGDDWSGISIDDWMTRINTIKSLGTPTSPALFRLFSHGPYEDTDDAASFRAFIDALSSEFGNDVWVPSTTEMYEYIETKSLVSKSQTIEGNKLIVEFDLSAIPDENRNQSMSLLVDGGTITGLTVTGADSYTYNTATGLVNIEKVKTTGFLAPITDQEPPRIINATYSTSNPNRVELTFNMPVHQSIKAAYEIKEGSGFTIDTLTGSGITWYLNLNQAVTSGLKVDYYGQTGNVIAVDTENTLKGTSIIGRPIVLV